MAINVVVIKISLDSLSDLESAEEIRCVFDDNSEKIFVKSS